MIEEAHPTSSDEAILQKYQQEHQNFTRNLPSDYERQLHDTRLESEFAAHEIKTAQLKRQQESDAAREERIKKQMDAAKEAVVRRIKEKADYAASRQKELTAQQERGYHGPGTVGFTNTPPPRQRSFFEKVSLGVERVRDKIEEDSLKTKEKAKTKALEARLDRERDIQKAEREGRITPDVSAARRKRADAMYASQSRTTGERVSGFVDMAGKGLMGGIAQPPSRRQASPQQRGGKQPIHRKTGLEGIPKYNPNMFSSKTDFGIAPKTFGSGKKKKGKKGDGWPFF